MSKIKEYENTDDQQMILDFFGNYQLSRKSGKKLLKLGARDEI